MNGLVRCSRMNLTRSLRQWGEEVAGTAMPTAFAVVSVDGQLEFGRLLNR